MEVSGGPVDSAEVEFFSKLQELIKASRSVHLSKTISKICGVDARYDDENRNVVAAAVLFKDGKRSQSSVYRGTFTYPYVSGLMYLHEGPFAVSAVEKLVEKPDLVCFDAHGIAHPRFAGLATICGMVLGIPSIGIAKTLLVGREATSKEGLSEIVYGRKRVGFSTYMLGKRYWSPGFSVTVRQLKAIVSEYGKTCLESVAEADRMSRKS